MLLKKIHCSFVKSDKDGKIIDVICLFIKLPHSADAGLYKVGVGVQSLSKCIFVERLATTPDEMNKHG
jgi:hypothetical protein